jgi:hypothetical protein
VARWRATWRGERATYLVHAAVRVITGRAAMEQGIELERNERPGAGVVGSERNRP